MELELNEDGQYQIDFTVPQTEFFLNEEKYKLFVAGFGAGKSTAMGAGILSDLSYPFKGLKVGAYAPTYDLLKLITIPYIEELLHYAGVEYKLNRSDYIFYLPDQKQIILRSMDNPSRIVGYQTFRAHIDEIDTLRKDQANDAWNKIVARNRQQVPMMNPDGSYVFEQPKNLPEEEREFVQVDYIKNKDGTFERCESGEGDYVRMMEMNKVSAYSTPEGFNFCYERWEKNPAKGYVKVKAPTYSNPNLPPDYIPSLRATYPAELIEAYIEGEFVNLTSGAVYRNFDRQKNHTDEVIQEGEPLHVGMDFNVMKMSAAICVIREGLPRQLDEIFGSEDTPSLCRELQERFPNNPITVYPDSAAKTTSSKSASQSDLSIIREHNFKIKSKSKNPFIKDRVASLNAMILNGNGERRFLINTDNCPNTIECLEQQVYGQDGNPDKTAGKDHLPDALGYLIYYLFPIKSAKISSGKVRLFAR